MYIYIALQENFQRFHHKFYYKIIKINTFSHINIFNFKKN